MEIKTLQAIKDEIAQKRGYANYMQGLRHLSSFDDIEEIEEMENEAAEAYAYQMCEAQKEKCGEIVEKNFGIVARHVAETEPNVCNPKTKNE